MCVLGGGRLCEVLRQVEWAAATEISRRARTIQGEATQTHLCVVGAKDLRLADTGVWCWNCGRTREGVAGGGVRRSASAGVGGCLSCDSNSAAPPNIRHTSNNMHPKLKQRTIAGTEASTHQATLRLRGSLLPCRSKLSLQSLVKSIPISHTNTHQACRSGA